MKSETDKKQFRKFIKDNSDMLSTLGIFSALAFSVSNFVPSYIGFLLSILFSLLVVVFLLEILMNLVETGLIKNATGKLFGTIILVSFFLLFLHILLYIELQNPLAFNFFLTLLIFMTTIPFVYSTFINHGHENKFFEKTSRASRLYKFLCGIILIASFLISYAIYKKLDDKIKNYVQSNYTLTKTGSLK